MNRIQKAVALVAASAVIGFGGFVSTTATAATNDEVADYLTSAVAAQLGMTDTTSLRTIVIEAMNNGLIQQSVTDAAAAAVDGTSTLTADEIAALLDANLTQQIGAIEQQLIDLGVLPDPNVPVDPPVDPTDPPVDPSVDDDDVYGHNDDDDDDYDEVEGYDDHDDDDDSDLDDDEGDDEDDDDEDDDDAEHDGDDD